MSSEQLKYIVFIAISTFSTFCEVRQNLSAEQQPKHYWWWPLISVKMRNRTNGVWMISVLFSFRFFLLSFILCFYCYRLISRGTMVMAWRFRVFVYCTSTIYTSHNENMKLCVKKRAAKMQVNRKIVNTFNWFMLLNIQFV